MATVTQIVDSEFITWTIKSLYPQITINSLFSFINYDGYFRISVDNQVNWSEWDYLTEENLRNIDIDLENSELVVQFRIDVGESLLAINDALDLLDINDDEDHLKVNG